METVNEISATIEPPANPAETEKPAPIVAPGAGEEIPQAEPDREKNSAGNAESFLPVGDQQPETLVTRNLEWYRLNVDWSKSNGEISRQVGVSKQRISVVRKELFPDPADRPPLGRPPKSAPEPLPPQAQQAAAPEAAPDFSDISGEPAPKIDPAPIQQPALPVDRTKLAEMFFGLFVGITVKVFDDENWKPADEKEQLAMVTATKNYLDSINMPDLSPGWALVLVAGVYAAPRFAQPKTKNRLQLAWAWFKSKLPKRKKPSLNILSLKKD